MDVLQVQRAAEQLGSLEARYGGGVVGAALAGKAKWAEGLLRSQASDEVRVALMGAVAQLHRKAASAALDMGRASAGRHHLSRGMELAKAGKHDELLVCLLYTAGRAERHSGDDRSALHLFQLGHSPATAARSWRLLALMEINSAVAWAKLGMRDLAVQSHARACEHFALAQDASADWLGWIDSGEIRAMEGVMWATLSEEERAISALVTSLRHRGDSAPVYSAFSLAELATAHLRNGDINEGVRVGMNAVDLVEPLRSQRARDRLAPLRVAALSSGRQAGDLVHRITLARRR
ncbi:hypothetical protein [Streptoalloteichus hindustanus]|uniref:hypothetical protein n=1 Tax=Streptoalloteichus hindustanus TaxID=2017 RepID=UPI0011611780|nr:hypothetical protein [Streptoalloteichus hindustanus]